VPLSRRGQPDARLQRILSSGELRVGVSADRAPLNMKNRRGEVVGFEADIVQALATTRWDSSSFRREAVCRTDPERRAR